MLHYNFEDIGRPNLLLGNWSCQSTNSTHTTSGTVNITLPTGMTLNDLIGKTLAFSYDYSVEGDRLNNTGNYSKDRYGIHGSMSVKTTSSASVSTQYPFAGYLEALPWCWAPPHSLGNHAAGFPPCHGSPPPHKVLQRAGT